MQTGIQAGSQFNRLGRALVAGLLATDLAMERDIQILAMQVRVILDITPVLLFLRMVAISIPASPKIRSNESFLSTSIFPVDEPRKSFSPGTRLRSSLRISSILSFVPPKKKE